MSLGETLDTIREEHGQPHEQNCDLCSALVRIQAEYEQLIAALIETDQLPEQEKGNTNGQEESDQT